jgi:hypothetical protein
MLMAQIGQTKPATVLPAPPPLLPPYQPSGMVKPDATSPQTVTPQPQP